MIVPANPPVTFRSRPRPRWVRGAGPVSTPIRLPEEKLARHFHRPWGFAYWTTPADQRGSQPARRSVSVDVPGPRAVRCANIGWPAYAAVDFGSCSSSRPTTGRDAAERSSICTSSTCLPGASAGLAVIHQVRPCRTAGRVEQVTAEVKVVARLDRPLRNSPAACRVGDHRRRNRRPCAQRLTTAAQRFFSAAGRRTDAAFRFGRRFAPFNDSRGAAHDRPPAPCSPAPFAIRRSFCCSRPSGIEVRVRSDPAGTHAPWTARRRASAVRWKSPPATKPRRRGRAATGSSDPVLHAPAPKNRCAVSACSTAKPTPV